MQPKEKPEHIKVGAVRVTLWRDTRKSSDGRAFESRAVTIDRAYKDSHDEWQNTNSLRENDIPKAVVALLKAYIQIMEKNAGEPDGNGSE